MLLRRFQPVAAIAEPSQPCWTSLIAPSVRRRCSIARRRAYQRIGKRCCSVQEKSSCFEVHFSLNFFYPLSRRQIGDLHGVEGEDRDATSLSVGRRMLKHNLLQNILCFSPSLHPVHSISLCEMDPSSLSACVRRALFVSQDMYVTMAVMIAASDSYHDAHAVKVPREERVLCFVCNGG